MPVFGLGLEKLLVIVIVAVVVFGPDKMPQMARDLARWIRRMRAYGEHLTRDFSTVIADLEKEVGNNEDWREIASLVTRQGVDLNRAIQTRPTVDSPGTEATPPTNVVSIDASRTSEAELTSEATESQALPSPGEDKPWYVPARTPHHRSLD